MVPGVVIFSKRSAAIAAWFAGTDLAFVKATLESRELLLEVGLDTQYLLARIRTPEQQLEAELFEEGKVRGTPHARATHARSRENTHARVTRARRVTHARTRSTGGGGRAGGWLKHSVCCRRRARTRTHSHARPHMRSHAHSGNEKSARRHGHAHTHHLRPQREECPPVPVAIGRCVCVGTRPCDARACPGAHRGPSLHLRPDKRRGGGTRAHASQGIDFGSHRAHLPARRPLRIRNAMRTPIPMRILKPAPLYIRDARGHAPLIVAGSREARRLM
eukprot:5845300-Pleurochrysis_carterae.AAC.2